MAPQPSKWVRLINNATGTAYVSSGATDSTGLWTISNVPTGAYTVYSGTSATGPWSATGDANYEVSGLDGTPAATANYGSVNVGSGPWDGSTSGFFTGHASGTVLAGNAPAAFAGNLLDLQVGGSSLLKVGTPSGVALSTLTAAGGLNLFFANITGVTAERLKLNSRLVSYTITAGYSVQRFNLFQADQIAAGSALNVPTAATVAITGAPTATGSATITNSYALWVQADPSRFDGNLTMGAGTKIIADSGTATGAALAATLSKQTGTVTTEALTTAAGAAATYTVTNTLVATTSQVFVAVRSGTNTIQPAYATNIAPGAGSFTVDLRNGHASSALNGTLKFAFWVVP